MRKDTKYALNAKEALETLKINIREGDSPFFTDKELIRILEEHEFDLMQASYEALIRKAENDGVRLPNGLTISGSREYWLGLAKMYRTDSGGILARVDDIRT